MSFVHGHARETGWVVAHLRAPTDAEDGQLPLLPEPSTTPVDDESAGEPDEEPDA